MPTPSTQQTNGMNMGGTGGGGGVAGLDSNGYIANIAFLRRIVAKVAAYTVLVSESGTLFTNKGATSSVTFTLPAIAACPTGFEVEFYTSAAQVIIVAAPSGKMIAYNNAAATSVSFGTTSKIAGGRFRVTFDGALYMASAELGSDVQVITVA